MQKINYKFELMYTKVDKKKNKYFSKIIKSEDPLKNIENRKNIYLSSGVFKTMCLSFVMIIRLHNF